MNNSTAIIGYGAAGLMASSLLGPEAFILEHEAEGGKKLLMTGGGKCNFTTTDPLEKLVTCYYEKKNFVSPALHAFPPEKIIAYMESLGVKSKAAENGKVFPLSEKAEDIKSALAKRSGKVFFNEEPCSIEKKDGIFHIHTDKREFSTKYLIIATGGITFAQSGSNGSITPIVKKLGHTIIPQKGVLTEIILPGSPLSKAEGVSLNLRLKAGKAIMQGEAVITRNGISGPAAENFSHYIENGDEIEITFIDLKKEDFRSFNQKAMLKNALPLPQRITETLLPSLKDKRISELSGKEQNEIITALSGRRERVTLNGKRAMCTKGGVSTKEIDRKTMESKIVENLYFAGEVIDVDGMCGGYNLSWAFASAYAAYCDIQKKKLVLS